MEVKVVLRILGEQIAHHLIVNFQVGDTHKELGLVRIIRNFIEDVLEGSRHDSSLFYDALVISTGHRMGLTCTRLAVSKYRTVVAFQDLGNDRTGGLLVDIRLDGIVSVREIEGKKLGLFLLALGLTTCTSPSLQATI